MQVVVAELSRRGAQLVSVEEDLAVATAGAHLAEPFDECGGTRRHRVAVADGVTVTVVARELVKHSSDVATQAFVLEWTGDLDSPLMNVTFGFVHYRSDVRHAGEAIDVVRQFRSAANRP